MSPTEARLEVLAAALRALAAELPDAAATATAERLRTSIGATLRGQPLVPAADAAMAAELAVMLAALGRIDTRDATRPPAAQARPRFSAC